MWVAARSLDDRSYLTASSSWVCETLVRSSGELRSGALVVDSPVGDFHVSCGSRFTSRGMQSSCWPPSPLGFWSPLPHDAAAFACDISSFCRRMVSARSSGSHPVGLEWTVLVYCRLRTLSSLEHGQARPPRAHRPARTMFPASPAAHKDGSWSPLG